MELALPPGGTPGAVCSNTPFHGLLPPFEGWLHRVGATARPKFLVERRRPILLLLPVRICVSYCLFVALATLCCLLGSCAAVLIRVMYMLMVLVVRSQSGGGPLALCAVLLVADGAGARRGLLLCATAVTFVVDT